MTNIDYQEHIERAIDFIEENLCNDITLASVAAAAGYSEYHFIRIFRMATGLTPADYIRKRRISEICRQMETDSRPICDIAFAYGFHSKENFVRAFKAEHHILPTEFKSAQNSLKLYGRMDFRLPPLMPEARLVELSPFSITAYPCDEDYPPNFWNKYNAKNWSKQLSGGKTVEDFGACWWNPATQKLDYYIGIRSADAKGNPAGTVQLPIAGGLYALFDTPTATHFNFINTIHQTWEYIAQVWLPENNYRRTGGFELESYTESSRTFSETIYIPIEKTDTFSIHSKRKTR